MFSYNVFNHINELNHNINVLYKLVHCQQHELKHLKHKINNSSNVNVTGITPTATTTTLAPGNNATVSINVT